MTQIKPRAASLTPPVVDDSIFREYDIRGTVGQTLTVDTAYHVGCAFGTYCRKQGLRNVAVCYDGRLTSPQLKSAVEEGLMRVGCQVVSVGMGPTPMLYFAVKHLPTDAGIMITGSHNPPDMNGFKMTTKNGPVFGQAVQDIKAIIQTQDYSHGTGTQHDSPVKSAYVARLLKDARLSGTSLNIAWDAGNGAAGAVLPALLDKLPGQHLQLYCDVDGRFPNHHPDPTVDKNLADLIAAVKTYKCDLGIAFDGDADRIGVVDENGTVIRSDMLLALYAAEVLERHPGAPIIGDIKSSAVLFDEVTRLGGQPVIWKTGHSMIKSKMQELNAPLAGELSGHIFFADGYYGFDDGLYCAIRLLNLLADTQGEKTLSQLMAHLPQLHATPEIRFEVPESDKFALITRMQDLVRAQKNHHSDWDLIDIDGIRVNTPDGWWLMRASNTQNALSTRVEAVSADALARLKQQAMDIARQVGISFSFDADNQH
ncbi:MAG: phosphomannomutase/phosphoglucomutase [Pseudomonadota bacterium]